MSRAHAYNDGRNQKLVAIPNVCEQTFVQINFPFPQYQVQLLRTSKQSVIEEVITRVEETEKEVIEEKTIRKFTIQKSINFKCGFVKQVDSYTQLN